MFILIILYGFLAVVFAVALYAGRHDTDSPIRKLFGPPDYGPNDCYKELYQGMEQYRKEQKAKRKKQPKHKESNDSD